MKGVDRELFAAVALYMLEELAWRGRVRLKYWKTYRMVKFWLGGDVADMVVKRLVEGGYIKVEGDRAVLLRVFTPKRRLGAVLREAYSLVAGKSR